MVLDRRAYQTIILKEIDSMYSYDIENAITINYECLYIRVKNIPSCKRDSWGFVTPHRLRYAGKWVSGALTGVGSRQESTSRDYSNALF